MRAVRRQGGRCWVHNFFSSPALCSRHAAARTSHRVFLCSVHQGRRLPDKQQPLPEPHAKWPPVPGQAEGHASAHAKWRQRRVITYHFPSFLCRLASLLPLPVQHLLSWLTCICVLFACGSHSWSGNSWKSGAEDGKRGRDEPDQSGSQLWQPEVRWRGRTEGTGREQPRGQVRGHQQGEGRTEMWPLLQRGKETQANSAKIPLTDTSCH